MVAKNTSATTGRVLHKLEETNVLRHEYYAVDARGRHIKIEGANGKGKTSIQEGIWVGIMGLSAKQFPEFIHQGANQARIYMELGPRGGRADLIIDRVITREGMKLKVVQDGEPVRVKPQDFLNSLWSKIAIDPSVFLDKRPQDQVDQVLSVCGILPPVDQVTKICGEVKPTEPGESADSYLMRLSADTKGEIYITRMEKGRVVEQKKHALAEQGKVLLNLGGALRPDEQVLSASELLKEATRLNAQGEDRRRAIVAAEEASRRLETARVGLDALAADDGRLAKEIAGLEAKLAELRQQRIDTAERAAQAADRVKELEQADQAAADAARKIPNPAMALRDVQARIATVEQTNQALVERRSAQDQVDRLGKELAEAEVAWELEERRLTLLRDLRLHILDGIDLGIKGLKVGNGELRLNGVPFIQASTAEQLRVACAIAFKTGGSFKLLRLDQAERLDAESKELVFQLADEAGWQCFMTAVADTFKVRDAGGAYEVIKTSTGEVVGRHGDREDAVRQANSSQELELEFVERKAA